MSEREKIINAIRLSEEYAFPLANDLNDLVYAYIKRIKEKETNLSEAYGVIVLAAISEFFARNIFKMTIDKESAFAALEVANDLMDSHIEEFYC